MTRSTFDTVRSDITGETGTEPADDEQDRARRAVAAHAVDTDDARRLLAMLGLEGEPS